MTESHAPESAGRIVNGMREVIAMPGNRIASYGDGSGTYSIHRDGDYLVTVINGGVANGGEEFAERLERLEESDPVPAGQSEASMSWDDYMLTERFGSCDDAGPVRLVLIDREAYMVAWDDAISVIVRDVAPSGVVDPNGIVGYTYRGECYTPAGLIAVVQHEDGGTIPGATVEDKLNHWALTWFVDRSEPGTFSSDDFPTPLYADDVKPGDTFVQGIETVTIRTAPALEHRNYTSSELSELGHVTTLPGVASLTTGSVFVVWNRYSIVRVFRAVEHDLFEEIASTVRPAVDTYGRAQTIARELLASLPVK
jgi:hypothetical protein